MKHIGLLTTLLCCLSCAQRPQLAARPELPEHAAVRAGDAPYHVSLLARDVHSEKYAAWELVLWRMTDSGQRAETCVTYLTSVATDAFDLTVHYKRVPDSGAEYVAIRELNTFFAIQDPGDDVGAVVSEEEYTSANAEPVELRVGGISREVEQMQFPLLSSRENEDGSEKGGDE